MNQILEDQTMKRLLLPILLLSTILLFWGCSDPEEDDVTAPAAPTGLAYDINLSGDGQIYISWTAPEDNDVADYGIYRDSGSGTFTLLNRVNETYYLDTDLDYAVTYGYKVTAFDDSENESAFSNSVSLAPSNRFSPATPIGLEIKAHNIPAEYRTDVELTWQANTENDFSHYKIYRAANEPFFTANESSYLDSVTDVFYYDESVDPDNTYYYAIIAYDLGGKASDPSSVVFDTPLLEPTLIDPVGNAVVTSLNPTFRWTNVNQAVKYKIIVRTSAQTGDIWDMELNATSESEMTVTYPTTAQALSANTQYFWFISAYSQAEGEINSYTAPDAFRTP